MKRQLTARQEPGNSAPSARTDASRLAGRSPEPWPAGSADATRDGGIDLGGLAGVSATPQPYAIRDGRFCHLTTDRGGGRVATCLCNFTAHIDEEITYDDGAELRREFRVSGRLDTGEALPLARVGASELAALGWILREWGARAVVFAGHGTRDHLRTALQTLSRPTRRRIFRHTGWIEHEGARVSVSRRRRRRDRHRG